MKTDLYNIKNERIGTVDLPDRVFGVKWNPDLVHQALRVQLNNKRTKAAHAKGHSEVRGGGKKPWRQKGTGRARHGSIRSPLWKGGGVTHGPTKERDYALKINRKMKQLAIFSVLSRRFRDGEIKAIESLEVKEAKTRLLSQLLNFFVGNENKSLPSTLLIPSIENKNIYKTSKNLAKVRALSAKSLNVHDLLKYKNILIDKEALEIIDKHYHEVK